MPELKGSHHQRLWSIYVFLRVILELLPAVVKHAAKLTALFSVDFSALVQKGEHDLVSLEQTQVISAKQSKYQHFIIIKAQLSRNLHQSILMTLYFDI